MHAYLDMGDPEAQLARTHACVCVHAYLDMGDAEAQLTRAEERRQDESSAEDARDEERVAQPLELLVHQLCYVCMHARACVHIGRARRAAA